MKKVIHAIGLHLLLMIAIFSLFPGSTSCKPSSTLPEKGGAKIDLKSNSGIGQNKENAVESGCVRGIPEPVLKKSTFKRLSVYSAREEYTLNRNVTLTIQHGGCAHYSESYYFKVKKPPEMKNDWRKWMKFTADQLRTLPVRNVVASQIKDMANTLENQSVSKAAYSYKTEIQITEGELLSFDVRPSSNGETEIIIVYQIVL